VPSARLGPLLRALALVAGVAVPAAAPPPAGAADTVELVIRRDPGLTAAERSALRDDAGVRFERRVRLADAEVVTVPAADAEQALRDLRADPDVRWAQRDDGVSAQAVRTDPGFGYLWGLDNTGQTILGVAGDADADMDVPEAWTRSTGAGQTIAVVDTGADAAHADLAGQLATNAGEMGGKETNGLDDDADGLVDNWRGYDFAYGDATPSDIDGHGSHVAGTIAAANGNGLGVTGVAPDARVLVLKALDDAGSGQWSDVANAFDYAGDIGVRVVNASLGGAGEVPVVSDVIAQHPNTLYVVAAGNTATNLDNQTYSPCEAPHANVLCVGASDSTDRRASFSSFSPTAVDVFAPGVDVLSTTGGSYAFMSGTSMAAPHVAALAALILAHRPGLTAAQVKQAIMVSSERRAALALFGADGDRRAERRRAPRGRRRRQRPRRHRQLRRGRQPQPGRLRPGRHRRRLRPDAARTGHRRRHRRRRRRQLRRGGESRSAGRRRRPGRRRVRPDAARARPRRGRRRRARRRLPRPARARRAPRLSGAGAGRVGGTGPGARRARAPGARRARAAGARRGARAAPGLRRRDDRARAHDGRATGAAIRHGDDHGLRAVPRRGVHAADDLPGQRRRRRRAPPHRREPHVPPRPVRLPARRLVVVASCAARARALPRHRHGDRPGRAVPQDHRGHRPAPLTPGTTTAGSQGSANSRSTCSRRRSRTARWFT
jgi:subtilisin family serine protease